MLVKGESEVLAVSDTSKDGPNGQLKLNLDASMAKEKSSIVVRLVDAETRALRREAIERVIKNGIFAPPKVR